MLTTDEILDDVLRREDWPTFSDRPSDRGGPTKGGITLDTYNAWRQSRGLPPVTAEQFDDALDEAQARAIYRERYLKPWDFVANEAVRTLLADWAVTSWHDDPARALQAELAGRGQYSDAPDGKLGPKTRGAWAAFAGYALPSEMDRMRRALAVRRDEFYLQLALLDAETVAFLETHPRAQLHNLLGWHRRVREWFL